VVLRIVAGRLNRQIAEELWGAERTVEAQRAPGAVLGATAGCSVGDRDREQGPRPGHGDEPVSGAARTAARARHARRRPRLGEMVGAPASGRSTRRSRRPARASSSSSPLAVEEPVEGVEEGAPGGARPSARETAERREARGEQVGPNPREQEGTHSAGVRPREVGAGRRALFGSEPCTRLSGLRFHGVGRADLLPPAAVAEVVKGASADREAPPRAVFPPPALAVPQPGAPRGQPRCRRRWWDRRPPPAHALRRSRGRRQVSAM